MFAYALGSKNNFRYLFENSTAVSYLSPSGSGMPGRERGMNKWEITEKIEMERLRTGAEALNKNSLTHTLDEKKKKSSFIRPS